MRPTFLRLSFLLQFNRSTVIDPLPDNISLWDVAWAMFKKTVPFAVPVVGKKP